MSQVLWIYGLSGSGKSTLSNHVAERLRCKNYPVIRVDGDLIREVFSDVDYTREGRWNNASRISKLTKYLAQSDGIIIVSVLSLFSYWREWNRSNIENYYEVFIDCPIEHLIERDTKGLYSKELGSSTENVVGIDIPFDYKKTWDLKIENKNCLRGLLDKSDEILRCCMP